MNTETLAAMRACIRALSDELTARSASNRALEEFATGIAEAEAGTDIHPRSAAPDHPAFPSLERALANVPAGSEPGGCRGVRGAAARLVPGVQQRRDRSAPRPKHDFGPDRAPSRRRRRHAACMPGLFLVAPDTDYPLHTHTAPEVYYCVSGKLTLRHGGRRKALLPASGRVLHHPFRTPAFAEDGRRARAARLHLADGTALGELVVVAGAGTAPGRAAGGPGVPTDAGSDSAASPSAPTPCGGPAARATGNPASRPERATPREGSGCARAPAHLRGGRRGQWVPMRPTKEAANDAPARHASPSAATGRWKRSVSLPIIGRIPEENRSEHAMQSALLPPETPRAEAA